MNVVVAVGEGQIVDSVTATRGGVEQECDDGGLLSVGVRNFNCWEQGAGTYVIRVRSDAQTWTKSIKLQADEEVPCHVVPGKLHFDLAAETADPAP